LLLLLHEHGGKESAAATTARIPDTHTKTYKHTHPDSHTSTGESKSAHHRYGCSGNGWWSVAAATLDACNGNNNGNGNGN